MKTSLKLSVTVFSGTLSTFPKWLELHHSFKFSSIPLLQESKRQLRTRPFLPLLIRFFHEMRDNDRDKAKGKKLCVRANPTDPIFRADSLFFFFECDLSRSVFLCLCSYARARMRIRESYTSICCGEHCLYVHVLRRT